MVCLMGRGESPLYRWVTQVFNSTATALDSSRIRRRQGPQAMQMVWEHDQGTDGKGMFSRNVPKRLAQEPTGHGISEHRAAVGR